MPMNLPNTLGRYAEGQTLRVHRAAGDINVRIVAARPLGSHRHDFGALAADTLAQRCTHIQQDTGVVAEFFFVILHSFEVELKHPQATLFWAGKTPSSSIGSQWRARPWQQDNTLPKVEQEANWQGSHFWVWEDEDPRFDLYPIVSAGQVQGHCEFYGYKYRWQEISEQGQSDLWIDKFSI